MKRSQSGHERRERQNGDCDRRIDPDSTPLVSAIVTTYDRPDYLRTAAESVLEQTYDEVELVVVDDHSRTNTREALEELDIGSLSGFQYVRHEENRGANAARNTGIEAASGEYVAFLDDDDRWIPEKLERQVAAIRSASDDVGVVYTGIETVEQDGRGVQIPPPIEGNLTKTLLCRNVVGTMSVVMARTDVASAVPLDESFPAWADLEWYVRLSRRTGFERLPEPLTVYEFTSQNRLSDDIEKKIESYERFLDRFDPIAAEYGRFFRRKMRGWAAYRVGSSALQVGRYDCSRRFFAAAVASYPFEPKFHRYLLASLGGKTTHRLARACRRAIPSFGR